MQVSFVNEAHGLHYLLWCAVHRTGIQPPCTPNLPLILR
jgi:hypothetical protein